MFAATLKLGAVCAMSLVLSGCFLTKLVSMPLRVTGSLLSVTGAVISVVPVVGNSIDEALETADTSLDLLADRIDDVPI
ncbi:MAG: hypothetical protein Q8L72_06855 [Moraxellaceae bacterium]|nr:hypothetical protein [Moraxellaceae bacterium]